MNRKKIMTIVGLLAVVVVAVVFAVKMTVRGRPKEPEAISKAPMELIDTETLELITKSNAEWRKLAAGPGVYKNPKTGRATMVVPFVCHACGKKIPHPAAAATTSAGKTVTTPSGQKIQLPSRVDPSFMKNAKCPRCGKNPFTGR